MSKNVTIKYYANSEYATEPLQARKIDAGYDLFAAQCKTLLPRSVTCILVEIKIAIPNGYFRKIYPRSGLPRNQFVSCDGGVLDSGFRGVVAVFMTNHDSKLYTVKIDDRIAQLIIHKKIDVEFETVYEENDLGKTNRAEGEFGSTGKN